MIKAAVKLLMVVAAVSAVTGCKLAVMVTSGGDVTSLSGTRDCAGGTVCEFQITDANFSESFTAVAKPGYEFVKWQKSSGFLCGDSTSPTCTVALSGNAVLDEAIIALFDMSYIMPTFKDVGIDTDRDGTPDRVDADDDNDGLLDVDDACPLEGPNLDGFGCPGIAITDTITANGKVWAQADLISGLSWNSINAICPSGICAGMLNGFNVTGWTWASADDLNELYNFYAGVSVLGPGPDKYYEVNSQWAPLFFASGWRPALVQPTFTWSKGWVSTRFPDEVESGLAYIGQITDAAGAQSTDNAATSFADYTYRIDPSMGAWFYRSP